LIDRFFHAADDPDGYQARQSAFREEFFGPVALFFRVKNEDEAVALANDSDFGLGGSVFTANVARGKRVASRIDTGMVFIITPLGQPQTCRSAASRILAMAASFPAWASRSS